VSNTRKRVLLLGECLIELNGTPFGALQQTFGGDSLNTALYLARLARRTVEVSYVTVVGQDVLSAGMVERWKAEGIDTRLVLRDPTRLPGIYLIELDERGERTFLYWRTESAARYLLQHRGFDQVAAGLCGADLIYLSGISLAILPAQDRAKLIQLLNRLAASGRTIAFDSNYRPGLWPSPEAARAAIGALLPATRLLFTTFDDESLLWNDRTPQDTLARLRGVAARTVVVKLGAAGCLYGDAAGVARFAATPAARVVDTTAAGDAFNAGFLAGWLQARGPEECCRAGSTLAAVVIQHKGAIVPATATAGLCDSSPHAP
jgi:2-dehydro-3-deoxygluconokinase